jgi:hypothetical protein
VLCLIVHGAAGRLRDPACLPAIQRVPVQRAPVSCLEFLAAGVQGVKDGPALLRGRPVDVKLLPDLAVSPETGLMPQPLTGAASHSQFCAGADALVQDGYCVLTWSRNLAQNKRYSSFLVPVAALAVDARTDFCQSLGSATTLNRGAGSEVPIRTTSSSTPKKWVSWSVCSLSHVSAWRCSSRNRVVIHTMVDAAVPAA